MAARRHNSVSNQLLVWTATAGYPALPLAQAPGYPVRIATVAAAKRLG